MSDELQKPPKGQRYYSRVRVTFEIETESGPWGADTTVDQMHRDVLRAAQASGSRAGVDQQDAEEAGVKRFCVCGQDLSRVDDCTLAMLGFCSESCLVHGDPDPSVDDEWRAPVDTDEYEPNAGGGNLDG